MDSMMLPVVVFAVPLVRGTFVGALTCSQESSSFSFDREDCNYHRLVLWKSTIVQVLAMVVFVIWALCVFVSVFIGMYVH